MSIDLREEESRELTQIIEQIASRMDCRFGAEDAEWRIVGKFEVRTCLPAAVPKKLWIAFSRQTGGTEFTVSVAELRVEGPLTDDVRKYAEEAHLAVAQRFGNDRVTVKKRGWR